MKGLNAEGVKGCAAAVRFSIEGIAVEQRACIDCVEVSMGSMGEVDEHSNSDLIAT